MRAWLIVFLLVLPLSLALVVENTGRVGDSPVLYGDNIVYVREGNVYSFDMSRKMEHDLGPGKNPSIFAFKVVFETQESKVDLNGDGDLDDSVLQMVDLRNFDVDSIKVVGRNPFIFSNTVVFSTKESELGIDFSNDGDLADDILRQYDIEEDKVINLKAVGDFPSVNQRSLIFSTEEKQINVDLNADGDKVDSIIRVYDQGKREGTNTRVVGSRPFLTKSGRAVFVSDGEINVIDAVSHKSESTGQRGVNPAMYGDTIIFERDGELFGLSLESKIPVKLKIKGSQPYIYDNTVVFVSSEKELGDLNDNARFDDIIIRYARAEDPDGDNVFDFIDNCPVTENKDQSDEDKDGIGDACDEEEVKVVSKDEQKDDTGDVGQIESDGGDSVGDENGFSWYWLLLLVLALPFVVKYGYRYYKKRQKSFGF